jgi:hypothetical protein
MMDFYFREEWRAPAAVGAIAFGVGAGVGYFVCNRRWTKVGIQVLETVEESTETLEKAAEDIRKQRILDFTKAMSDPDQPGDDAEIVMYQGEPVEDHSAKHLAKENPEPELEEDPADDWDQAEEESERSPDSPYVIHKDEYFNQETNYRQTALEYFAEDNILCDEQRVPIYSPEKVVGRLEFGRGSGDSDVVYIRNEKLGCEYEVIRINSSYQLEVLGLEAEEEAEAEEDQLRHSIRRFKLDE